MLANEEDIGAETLKRYEYQKLWNVFLVLDFALHKDKKAIYSEFLDDIAIEYFNPNQFEVIQVKTKYSKIFTLNNIEIRKTLNIFLSIEKSFSNKIGKYYILTNGTFRHSSKGYDIYRLISAFNSGSEQKKDSAHKFLREEVKEKGKLISRIKNIKDYDKEVVTNMFKKLTIEPQRKYSYEYLSQKIDEKIGIILKEIEISQIIVVHCGNLFISSNKWLTISQEKRDSFISRYMGTMGPIPEKLYLTSPPPLNLFKELRD